MLITATYHIYRQRPDREPIMDKERGKVMDVAYLDQALIRAEVFVANTIETEHVDWEHWRDTYVSDTDDGCISHCVISRKGLLRETNRRVMLFLKWTVVNE